MTARAITPEVVSTARGPIEVAVTGRPVGTAPVLLVVHGTPGDWRQGRTLAEDHADDATVLLVSRPGYGRTPLSAGRTPQEQAKAMVALLDVLGIATAVVVGISGGGPSSRALAAHHPQRCTGLVLCCAVAPERQPVSMAMRVLGGVPGLWRAVAALDRLRPMTSARQARVIASAIEGLTPTERRVVAADEGVRAALQRFLIEAPSTVSAVGMRNDVRTWRRLAALPDTTAVTVPTVVIHGMVDSVVPLECAQHHGKVIPGARLIVLPDLGHGLPFAGRAVLREQVDALLRAPAR